MITRGTPVIVTARIRIITRLRTLAAHALRVRTIIRIGRTFRVTRTIRRWVTRSRFRDTGPVA